MTPHLIGRVLWALGLAMALALVAATEVVAQGEHAQRAQGPKITVHDSLQRAQLPPLPNGMTIDDIVQGDAIYHGKGGCFACHGIDAEGLPAAGDALSVSLNWAQYDWASIDSLIDHGIPQQLTRSPMQMPPRGGKSDLTDDETERVAAYIWAISQTRGESWQGGHPTHVGMVPAGADKGTATRALARTRPPAERKPPQ